MIRAEKFIYFIYRLFFGSAPYFPKVIRMKIILIKICPVSFIMEIDKSHYRIRHHLIKIYAYAHIVSVKYYSFEESAYHNPLFLRRFGTAPNFPKREKVPRAFRSSRYYLLSFFPIP